MMPKIYEILHVEKEVKHIVMRRKEETGQTISDLLLDAMLGKPKPRQK